MAYVASHQWGSKLTLSWGGTDVPLLMPSFEGNLLMQRHRICSQETRDYAIMWLKPGVSPVLESVLDRDRQMDGRTASITIANMSLALRRVMHNKKKAQLTQRECATAVHV